VGGLGEAGGRAAPASTADAHSDSTSRVDVMTRTTPAIQPSKVPRVRSGDGCSARPRPGRAGDAASPTAESQSNGRRSDARACSCAICAGRSHDANVRVDGGRVGRFLLVRDQYPLFSRNMLLAANKGHELVIVSYMEWTPNATPLFTPVQQHLVFTHLPREHLMPSTNLHAHAYRHTNHNSTLR